MIESVNGRKPAYAIITALGLCAAAPLIVISMTPTNTDNAWWLGCVVLIVAGARFSWLMGSGQARLMEFSFWTFTYVFMGLAPLVQLRTEHYPGTTSGIDQDLNELTMLVILAGVLAAIAGLCIPWVKQSESSHPERLNDNRIIVLATFALVINATYILLLGPSVFFESRAALTLARDALTTNPIVNSLISASATVPLLVSFLTLLAARRRAAGGSRVKFTVLAVCTANAALFTVNPIGSARYMFGTFVLAMLAGLGAYATPTRVRTVAFAFLLGLVGVFPIADAFRRTATATISAADIDPLIALTTGDFDAFAQVNNTVLYVSEVGLTWGRQAVGVVLFWVPRDIWPTKPMDTGVLLAQFRGYQFDNLSAPLWAEFYINFGIAGVIIGMFALGVWMHRSDRRTVSLVESRQAPPIVALILPFYLIMLLRGSLLQAMAFLTVMVASALLVRDWSGRRRTLPDARNRGQQSGRLPVRTDP